MSGKAYTMKEMKCIVDYLTEHKAFAEIKGRKMWVDFANSKLTSRTWQSLKETFLKRILPDIHNPYYKLSVDQIRCFREGCDVIEREKNKLEILSVGDDSNSNAEKETETEKPGTSHDNNGEAAPGEDITCAKIPSHDRASVETIVIGNCYETDDDLRRVLESPKSDKNGNPNSPTPSKSLRDLITYSEPLTPMLQGVINDFASEDESDGELRMQIVENDLEPNPEKASEDPVIEIFDSDDIVEIIKTTENNLESNKATEDNFNKDTEVEPKKEKDVEESLGKDKITNDEVNKNKDMEDELNSDRAKDNDASMKKVEDGSKNNNDADTILRENQVIESNIENNKGSESNIEKDKTTEKSSEDKTEKESEQNKGETADTEEFVQPKIMSIKLRKRKNNTEKISEKKSSTKNIKNKAEMYEIFEPEILEQSNINGPKVDKLSNYAKNNDEIVSSTVSDKNTQNSTNSDTMLPNNQEALVDLEKGESKEENSHNDLSKSPIVMEKVVKPVKTVRKRAGSQDVASTSKVSKKKLHVNINGKEKAASDTDDVVIKKLIKTKLSKPKLDIKNNNDNNKAENKIEEAKDECGNDNSVDVAKDVGPVDAPPPSQPIIDSSQASLLNPCLQSVSLFAEQFNTGNYIDSESSEHETTPAASTTEKNIDKHPSSSARGSKNHNKLSQMKNIAKVPKATAEVKNKDKKDKNSSIIAMEVDEVVMLKSHSESESEPNKGSPDKDKSQLSQVAKAQRDKALANVFGFYSGGLKRKKRRSYRKKSAYYQPQEESSPTSSEWTSESDSEAYVSPPRGRRNKQARKYIKPQSARIRSLDDEGGLFVMYGKKIYPLVKDGKIIKNYLTYLPESDPEEEESYWKLKYVEERKRVAELKKLIVENKDAVAREKSPILPARTARNMSTSHIQGSPFKNAPNVESCKELVAAPEKETKKVENVDTGKTLKITFARNNQEVHVEGHWSNIHPVLAEVVEIFNKDTEVAATNAANNAATAKAVAAKRASESSGSVAVLPSPVDEGIPRIEVLEKVNKLETEIFKEIENLDHELNEEIEPSQEQSETNVTKRKRAASVRKSTSTNRSSEPHSSPSSTRSPKRQKTKKSSTGEPQDEVEQSKTPRTRNKKESKTQLKVPNSKSPQVTKEKVDEVDSTTSVASKRPTRTPKKESKELPDKPEVQTRSRRSKPAETKANSSQVDDDSEVRYMFPPARSNRKSGLNLSKNKRYMANPTNIYSMPHLLIQDESTQGYQDSDISPPKGNIRRKRRLSLSTVLYRNKRNNSRVKRKSFPLITDDASSDSSNAFQIIVRPAKNSSLKSEAYKSDSYQLLFPPSKHVLSTLEKIDEDPPVPNDNLHPNRFATLENRGRTLRVSVNRLSNEILSSYSNCNTDCGNSSNISLPVSPELSIVENLSISKELLSSVENYPTINEMQANIKHDAVVHNKYLMSKIDVSMPLMQQECGLHESVVKIKTEPSFDPKMSVVSNSLLNRIDSVNIEDAPSLSDSLDTRLRRLLLESAKKMSITTVMEEAEHGKVANKSEAQKKGKAKRCSTPRKKKDLKKPTIPIVDPVIEEEFMESYSYGGRRSCPPAIHVISENVTPKEALNTAEDSVLTEKTKRRKKDVIKVKILRPRKKSLQSRSPEITRNTSKTTVHTDSGINESGLTIQGFNESVDLIHNHSETCLLANECMGDSVEFIETNTKSIISLNIDSSSNDKTPYEKLTFQDCQDFVPDLFCQNAQSFCRVDCVAESEKLFTDNTSDTVYHSPVVSEMSVNSLITEDLSDETPHSSQPSNWYLLSEEDTCNTNAASRPAPNTVPSSFGSNLKQIFPITCAVPDLSTITESSNENSRKPTMSSANSTRNDLDSQSIFDMNSNTY